MIRRQTILASICALLTAGCSGLSFPSLPSFSLLEGNDNTRRQPPGSAPPLPSRPHHFRYEDASTRTTIRFARGSSLFEETAPSTLVPFQEALALDPDTRLLITGFTSRGAAPGADRVLGEQRALTIRKAIAISDATGSLAPRIHTTSFGSDRPPAGFRTPRDQVDIILFSSPTLASDPTSLAPSP